MVRIINSSKSSELSAPIFQKFKLLQIKDIYTYSNAHHIHPRTLYSMFMKNNEKCMHNIRQSKYFPQTYRVFQSIPQGYRVFHKLIKYFIKSLIVPQTYRVSHKLIEYFIKSLIVPQTNRVFHKIIEYSTNA